jgi:hypothetical protein
MNNCTHRPYLERRPVHAEYSGLNAELNVPVAFVGVDDLEDAGGRALGSRVRRDRSIDILVGLDLDADAVGWFGRVLRVRIAKLPQDLRLKMQTLCHYQFPVRRRHRRRLSPYPLVDGLYKVADLHLVIDLECFDLDF